MSLILRWTIGIQDTLSLSSFTENRSLVDLIWLAKLSISSFQRWFPDARFVLLYNGDDLNLFKSAWDKISFSLPQNLEIIDQTKLFGTGKFKNPYHFLPLGVWWKWIPFRLDSSCDEVSIDTDIICINEPKDWKQWLSNGKEIIVAPERFDRILPNTCGDFHSHPILKNKKPVNCGIVGHRKGFDFSERFFEITRQIKYGQTHDSLFITEQGAINIWVYSLAVEGINTHVLDFEKCAWIRDFMYYLEKGVKVETIHATTWHKKIARSLGPILEKRVFEDYPDDVFFHDIVKNAKNLDFYSRHVLRRQMGEDKKMTEYYF